MPSIKDVARLAGVSYTTVSHVINASKKVSAPTQARVRQAVEECGYVPSQAARAMRGGASKVFGIILPNISDPFCAEVALGAERAAASEGYSTVLVNTEPHKAPIQAHIERLLSSRIDGLIVVAGLFDHSNLVGRLASYTQQHAFPMVFIDHEPENLPADALVADAEQAAYGAVTYLVGLGHQRIGCISGPSGMPVADARLAGWRAALKKAGLEAPDEWLFEGDFTMASGVVGTETLLDNLTPRPTAIFACGDLMAVGALRAASRRGVLVPEQCSVMGMGGASLCEYVYPSLSSVGSDLRALGEQSVGLLLARIKGLADQPFHTRRRAEFLQIRESTGPVPS